MHDQTSEGREESHRPDEPGDARSGFAPPIDTGEIFRQLVEDELRNGRLTRARRKRIIQYATQLRMSAVQAGQLVEACRQKALESKDPAERRHALRLVEPRPERVPLIFKIALLIGLAILLDLLLLKWV
jgi:hypothetical protein